MNQGIHSDDILQWYMGPVESVQSVSANIKHKGIEVEDTIVSTLRFRNGALGTIECSTAVFPGAFKRIEIMGTTGTAILEESNLIKWQFEKAASDDELVIQHMQAGNVSHGGVSNPANISFAGHQYQLEDMIRSIETGKKPFIDAIEGRKSVEIVLAIYESATAWKEKVYTGKDYLEQMIKTKPGNVVVIAGNNQMKTEYIKRSIDAGLNVLADKPMAISTADFDQLKEAFAEADNKKLLLY